MLLGAIYLLSYGPFRAGVNYGFAGSRGRNDTAYAADVGADFSSLASGFLHENNVSPTVGLRYSF